eukprot:6201521-Pleurochrysis_carterae.AAC.1
MKGSLRPNSTLIVTANGTTAPKYRCDVDISLCTDKGKIVAIRLKDVLIMGKASHNLISLGRLATEEHVGVNVEATTGKSLLSLSGEHVVPLLNVGVLVVPASNTAVPTLQAVVTQGHRESANGTIYNDSRAATRALQPQARRGTEAAPEMYT